MTLLVIGEQSVRIHTATAAKRQATEDREPARETGDIKSKNTEEADRENMGQTEESST